MAQRRQMHFPFPNLFHLLIFFALFNIANSFFGGDCCCCDCCCDCCCGCCSPLLLAVPCCGCSSSYNSFGTYGGAIFGRRRRKRELYARTGPRSADFLNDHRCAERFWLKLVERKKKMEGRIKSTERIHDRVPAAQSPKKEIRRRNTKMDLKKLLLIM